MSRAPHHRLMAWQLARGLSEEVMALAAMLPDEFGTLGRQIDRAALASLRAIEDGAAASIPARRASSFGAARGELAELEASLDAFELLGLGPTGDLRERADRIGDLLTGLVDRAGIERAAF